MFVKKWIYLVVNTFLDKVGVLYLVRIKRDALKAYGWERSAKLRESIDAAGNPIPWMTYSSIDFLLPRINKDMRVFEYGSGNSTRWWAKHVGFVNSVEHDFEWYEKVKENIPKNASLTHIALKYDGDYCRALAVAGLRWNVVVVDGRDRVNCLKQSFNNIDDDGVIVLDNSERQEYQEGIDFLLANGFKKIEFRGLLPIVPYISETTVFYRDNNCLGL